MKSTPNTSIIRDPSLHIKKSHLVKVLTNYGNLTAAQMGSLVEYIMKEGKNYSTNKRSYLEGDPKLTQRASNISLNSRDLCNEFCHVLKLARAKHYHKNVTKIKPGDPEWDRLKLITQSALDFCMEFNLKTKEGFWIYCEIALNKMKPFSINKFPSLNQYIFNYYTAQTIIDQDITKALTFKMYECYMKLSNEAVGLVPNYKKNPETYRYFVEAKEKAVQVGISVETYIVAQFEGLAWVGIPSPLQLISDKALGRVANYLKKNDIKANAPKKQTVNWGLIKS